MTDTSIRRERNDRSLTTDRFLWSLVKRMYDQWIYARAEADLRRLSDRELTDIGLERDKIGTAVRGAHGR